MSISTSNLFSIFETSSKNHTNRSHIKPGNKVFVVKKEDQRSGRLTHGIVKKILTNKQHHTRGIKVRLSDGVVGRVQKIV